MTTTYTYTIVYAAVVGNYEPPEVLNLYDNEPAANQHAASEDDVEVRLMRVYSTYHPSQERS